MLKWLVTLFIALAVLAWVSPGLTRIGLGRLPGDFRIPMRGRVLSIPLASTALLSALIWLIGRLI